MLKRVMVVVLLGCVGLTVGVLATAMGGPRYQKTAEVVLRPNSDASHIVAMTKDEHPGVRIFVAMTKDEQPIVRAFADGGQVISVTATGSREGAFSAASAAVRDVLQHGDGKIKGLVSSRRDHIQRRPLGNPVHYGLVGLLAGLSAALGFLVPPRSRVTAPH